MIHYTNCDLVRLIAHVGASGTPPRSAAAGSFNRTNAIQRFSASSAHFPLFVELFFDFGPDLVPVDFHLLHVLFVLGDVLLLLAPGQMLHPVGQHCVHVSALLDRQI